MSLIPTTSSKLTKVKLKGYKMLTFSSGDLVEEIELQLNPDNLKVEYNITQDQNESTSTNPAMGESTYEPCTLEIETYADATGVLKGIGDKEKKLAADVAAYITKLKKVVYNYVDATHGPPFVAIEWGSVALESTHLSSGNSVFFKGQLTKLGIDYTLFSQAGVPIRAKISMSFKSLTDPKTLPTGQSPDLTHIHQIQMGDNLPTLSKRIYNRPTFYMQLARVNGLSSVYQLKPGQQLVIPPLEKSSR